MGRDYRKSKIKSHLQARPDKQFLYLAITVLIGFVVLPIVILSTK